MVFTQPAHQLLVNMLLLLHAEVQLGAVAGGQHDSALHQRLLEQTIERLVNAFWRKGDFFPQSNRSGFMINA